MPPKRKTTHTTPVQSPMAKRRATRGNGPLADTQPTDGGRQDTGLNGGYWSSPSKREPGPRKVAKTGSLKENSTRSASDAGADNESVDELLLSPSKSSSALSSNLETHAPTPAASRSRKLLAAVEVPLRASSHSSQSTASARNGNDLRRRAIAIPGENNVTASARISGSRLPVTVPTARESDDELNGYSPPEKPIEPLVNSNKIFSSPLKRSRSSFSSHLDDTDALPVLVQPEAAGLTKGVYEAGDADAEEDAELPSPPPSPSKKARRIAKKLVASFPTPTRAPINASTQDASASGLGSDLALSLPAMNLSRASPKKRSSAVTPPIGPIPMTPLSKPKKQIAGAPIETTSSLPTISDVPQASPLKFTPAKPAATPSRRKALASAPSSPTRLPRALPAHLHPYLHAQKRSILCAVQNPPAVVVETQGENTEPSTNELAYEQLCGLLEGTTERGEGNSCMLVGPRGSGKTRMIERVLCNLQQTPGDVSRPDPIVIHLSGHVQHTDRLAMREIARQLVQQTGDGSAFLDPAADEEEGEEEENAALLLTDEDENPFLDNNGVASSSQPGVTIRLPPTAHLPSLISTLPTLGRPVILVLDAFDLFALHARQALLYCLLDTVQHSQAAATGAHYTAATPGKGKGKERAQDLGWSGLAVIGVTTRVDTLELLEKRVKSRFSGRMIRTAGPGHWDEWEAIVRGILCARNGDVEEEAWTDMWETAVERFVKDKAARAALRETVALVKDVRMMAQVLTALTLALTPENPWPTHNLLAKAIKSQRCPPRFASLHTLHYPAICLLIAAIHERTAGHDLVTFEQLYGSFRDQVRKSQAAPVQVEGGGIGMVRCGRGVMIGAFEQLVAARIFVASGPSVGVGREFVKYRSAPEREDVKSAVEKMGKTNLKKWYAKAM